MSTFPYNKPTSQSTVQYPLTPNSSNKTGTHYSIYGIGGYMEVQNLSELSYTSTTIPINLIIDLSGNTYGVILNNDNISSGRRRLGMLAYVYETDSIYQYYIPNYDTAFNTATGSSAYEKRYTIFGTYETYVYPNSATTLLISGWTGDTIEGVGGATSSNARWKKLSFSGGSSGGTVNGSGTTNYIPKWTNSTTLGNSQIYNDGTNVIIYAPTSATSLSSTTVYLGVDSSGNTRTITANNIILDSDILDGGSY